MERGNAVGMKRFARLALATALLLLPLGCEKRPTLVTLDTQKEAIEILVELHAQRVTGAGLSAVSKGRKDAFEVTVPASELDRARGLLLKHDLPREKRSGLELYASGGGMIPTPTDERAKMMHAIAGELERTLETIDGVARARVHVVLPERDGLGEGKEKVLASASVLLTLRNFRDPADAKDARSAADESGLFLVTRVDAVGAEGGKAQAPKSEAGKPEAPRASVLSSAATLSGAVKELVSAAVPSLTKDRVTVVASVEPVREQIPISSVQEDKIARAESTNTMLYVACAVLGLLFVGAMARGVLRGRGPATA